MPNPFRRSGRAEHNTGEWLAETVGLCAHITEEWADLNPGGFALIGEIGEGKTAALDSWRHHTAQRRPDDRLFALTAGNLGADALQLEQVLLNALIDALGMTAFDAALKALNLAGQGRADALRQDEIFALIQQMLVDVEFGIHCLIDECQGPSEWFDAEGVPAGDFYTWAGKLKSLAEAFRRGNSSLVITITRSPWEQLPAYCQDRFIPLIAQPPSATEIHQLLERGLEEAEEGPRALGEGVAAWLFESDNAPNFRVLHDQAFRAWRRASWADSATLEVAHFQAG